MNSFFTSTKAEVPTLVLRGPWDSKAADYMVRNRLVGLRLSGYLGWHSSDLDFLRDSPFVEYLEILTTELSNVSGLYYLKQLKYLYLEGKTPTIQFSEFPRLQTLALGKVSARLHRDLLQAISLRKLAVSAPNPTVLSELGKLPLLQDLGISRVKMVDLAFVEMLPALRKLSIVACNSLLSLDGIQHAKELVVLIVEQAKHLRDVGCLAHLHGLRTLVLNQCPEIESILAISGLENLETVGLMQTTNIKDGDLSPLFTLPELKYATFLDRAHYSAKNEEFPKAASPYY